MSSTFPRRLGQGNRAQRSIRAPFRPQVEPLEDRFLLSTTVLSHLPTLSAPVVPHLAGNTASQVVTVQTSHPTLAPAASRISPKLADTSKAVAVSEPSQDWSSVPKLQQGKNECGTTSLAMIMAYLRGSKVTLDEVNKNFADINSAIHRRSWYGTAPSDLRNYARDHGLSAEMYNHSTIDELKSYLRQGYGIEVSISRPSGVKADHLFDLDIKEHYVIVIGFEMRNGQEYVKIRDPGDNNPDPKTFPSDTKNPDATYSMPLKVFQEKWAWPSDDGLRNFMIVYGKPGTVLPAGRLDGAEHSVGIAGVFTHDRDNLDRVIAPDNVGSWLHGAIALPAGWITPPTGMPPLILAGVGWGLSYGGEKLHDAGTKLPPVVSQIVTSAGDLLSASGKVLTQGSLGLSNAYNHVGAVAEDLAKGHVADAISHTVQVGVDIINGGVGIATAAAQTMTAPLTGLGMAIRVGSGYLPPGLGGVGKVVGRAVALPGQIGQIVVQGAGNVAGDVGNALVHLGQGNFGGAVRDVGQAAVEVGKTVANVASDAAGAVGGAVRDVGNAIAGFFGFGHSERPAIVDHRR
jgi:hypothetical protein